MGSFYAYINDERVDLTADDVDDAADEAIDLAADGDWQRGWAGWTEYASARAFNVYAHVRVYESDGTEVYSNNALMVAKANEGEPDCPSMRGHYWQDVQTAASGGTAMMFVAACERCGSIRTVDEDRLATPPRRAIEWTPCDEGLCEWDSRLGFVMRVDR